MPAADHRKALVRAEIGRLWQLADRLLAGVDEVGVFLARERKGADAEHAVFRLERDGDARGDMVGDERRDADAEVHIEAVLQFARGAGCHFVTSPGHYFSPDAGGDQRLSAGKTSSIPPFNAVP